MKCYLCKQEIEIKAHNNTANDSCCLECGMPIEPEKCKPKGMLLLSKPPQYQCKICSNTWFINEDVPNCTQPEKVEGWEKGFKCISHDREVLPFYKVSTNFDYCVCGLKLTKKDWKKGICEILYDEYGDVGKNGNIIDFIQKTIQNEKKQIMSKIRRYRYYKCNEVGYKICEDILELLK